MDKRSQNLNRNRSKSFNKDGDAKLSRLSPDRVTRQKERRALTVKGCETLREMVTCPICLDKLKKPKMLPCQHTFCLLCLQNCSNCDKSGDLNEKPKICCPQCRNSTVIPVDGLPSLPSNIYLQSLLDLIDSDKLEKEVIRCSSCQTVCVDSIPCRHCELVFCPLCQSGHIEKLRQIVEQIANQLESSSKQLLQRSKLIDNEFNDLRAKIKTETQIRIQKIRDTEGALLDTVTDEADREIEDIQLTNMKMSSTVNVIRTSFQEEFDRLNSPSEKVTSFLNMHQKATDLLAQVPKLGQLTLLFDPDDFSITVKRKASKDQAYDVNLASASTVSGPFPNDRDSPDSSSQDSHSRFYRGKSFSDRIKIGIGIVQRPAGIAVCPWTKEVYVVSMDSHKVNIFDNSGRFHRSFGSRGQNPGEFLCPFGIAFSVYDKKVIVSDKWKNCLNVYDEEGTFVKQIGLKGRSPGHFRSPEGVATDKNGRIYVCDTGNDRVQVLDADGALMFEVGVKNIMEGGIIRQKSIFNEPTGVAVTPDGNSIIVCDFGHHKVRIFNVISSSEQDNSWSAELSLTLGTKGQLKGQFYNPECVAVDNQGFILIGDSGNGRVQICRPDGKVVRMFGNIRGHSGAGHFSWISGIAVTEECDVIVSDFKNHCVKMF